MHDNQSFSYLILACSWRKINNRTLLQGLNPTVPFGVDDVNCTKNQMHVEVSKEAGARADVNGGGVTDSTQAGSDLVFVNNILPARSAPYGTLKSDILI